MIEKEGLLTLNYLISAGQGQFVEEYIGLIAQTFTPEKLRRIGLVYLGLNDEPAIIHWYLYSRFLDLRSFAMEFGVGNRWDKDDFINKYGEYNSERWIMFEGAVSEVLIGDYLKKIKPNSMIVSGRALRHVAYNYTGFGELIETHNVISGDFRMTEGVKFYSYPSFISLQKQNTGGKRWRVDSFFDCHPSPHPIRRSKRLARMRELLCADELREPFGKIISTYMNLKELSDSNQVELDNKTEYNVAHAYAYEGYSVEKAYLFGYDNAVFANYPNLRRLCIVAALALPSVVADYPRFRQLDLQVLGDCF